MATLAYQQPADVQLKVVTVNNEQPVKTTTGVASSKIFTISYSYLKKAFRTKVMKVLYAGKEPMYKVVLPCTDSIENCVYWLHREGANWNVIIGEELDAKLLKAITSAIDTLE